MSFTNIYSTKNHNYMINEQTMEFEDEFTFDDYYFEVGFYDTGATDAHIIKVSHTVFEQYLSENDLLKVEYNEHNPYTQYSHEWTQKLSYGDMLDIEWREYLRSRLFDYCRMILGVKDKLKVEKLERGYDQLRSELELEKAKVATLLYALHSNEGIIKIASNA